MSLSPTIEFDSVGKCFQTGARGALWAVRNFNLRCGEGELTCLVGPSGCGKTTLLRLAMGLEQPTEGRVRLNGSEAGAAREHPGFVSQEGDLLPWRRVEDNVALGLEIRGMPRKERLPIAREALRRVGLPDNVARSYPHELSGGMRQRVVLARMACLRPRVLLMDEPFANLDEATRHRLQDDLLEFWRTERQTLLFVTHSLDEAVFLADRIVVMTFAGIAADRGVDWPRPRNRASPEFFALVAELCRTLEVPR
jgi:ABC-type nitrate/sulfonate/bicarbonate transport system ATPase subunit